MAFRGRLCRLWGFLVARVCDFSHQTHRSMHSASEWISSGIAGDKWGWSVRQPPIIGSPIGGQLGLGRLNSTEVRSSILIPVTSMRAPTRPFLLHVLHAAPASEAPAPTGPAIHSLPVFSAALVRSPGDVSCVRRMFVWCYALI